MYDCLPLYHSVGGVVATGATLVGGGAVVLRERFSAQQFWSDSCAPSCTLFQYIGELCRYLLAGPPSPDTRRTSAAALLRQRPAGRGLGGLPGNASRSRRSSSTTPPPRATSRSTTARAGRARSAASRRFWRIAARWRWCASTSDGAAPLRDDAGILRALRAPTRSARPSA